MIYAYVDFSGVNVFTFSDPDGVNWKTIPLWASSLPSRRNLFFKHLLKSTFTVMFSCVFENFGRVLNDNSGRKLVVLNGCEILVIVLLISI